MFIFAQGASINNTNTVANNSAMLDLSSNAQGVLISNLE